MPRTRSRTEKRCPSFGVTLPSSEFYVNYRNKDGHSSKCKPCDRIAAATPHASTLHIGLGTTERYYPETHDPAVMVWRPGAGRFSRASPPPCRTQGKEGERT